MTEMPKIEEVQEFVLGLFKNNVSVRGKTKGLPVGLETPCHDCFHADIDDVDMYIGGPLQNQFGLEQFNLRYGLSSHCYTEKELGSSFGVFYEKYPTEKLGDEDFTLTRFSEMIFDLIKIQNGLAIS
jgi:hypothetical protein